MIHVFAWYGDGSDMSNGWPGAYRGSVEIWAEVTTTNWHLNHETFIVAVQEDDTGQLRVIGHAEERYGEYLGTYYHWVKEGDHAI